MRTAFLIISIFSASIALAAPSAPAGKSAKPESEDWKTLKQLLDKDRNGSLSQEESQNFNIKIFRALTINFERIDANQDGLITQAEYSVFEEKNDATQKADFKQADINNSGGLSMDELEAAKKNKFQRIVRYFSTADSDGDKEISFSEYELYNSKMKENPNNKRTEPQTAGKNKPKKQ